MSGKTFIDTSIIAVLIAAGIACNELSSRKQFFKKRQTCRDILVSGSKKALKATPFLVLQ